MKKYIDLHVHSNASDGTFTPAEIVEYAIEKELYAIALTDHDTLDGIEEAISVSKNRILVIPGIEISASINGTDIHILGLNIDYKLKEFNDKVNECKVLRNERNIKIIDKMKAIGIDISKEKMDECFGNASITRAHFAKFLVDNGYADTKEEAFSKYLKKGCSCYVPRVQMTPKDAIEIIKQAGGHPILAHPLVYKFSYDKLMSTISYLKEIGLEGIEAIYSNNSVDDDVLLKRIAKNYNLYVTGGSDFHGSIKPDIDLGIGRGNLKIPKEILKNIE